MNVVVAMICIAVLGLLGCGLVVLFFLPLFVSFFPARDGDQSSSSPNDTDSRTR